MMSGIVLLLLHSIITVCTIREFYDTDPSGRVVYRCVSYSAVSTRSQ